MHCDLSQEYKVEINEIYKGYLYSVTFDEADTDEYSRAIGLWKDLDYLVEFFEKNAKYVDQPFWREAGLDPEKPRASAERVASEAIVLAAHIRDLAKNAANGELPDFEDFFHPLGGKYSYVRELEPQKSYGTFDPSLLRLYAIRFGINTYLIVFGGIKLGRTIQESPGLGAQVFNRIDNVISFLKANGILESDDI